MPQGAPEAARQAACAGLALLALCCGGCGKKAPLRLPDQGPAERVAALRALVREGRVLLEFRAPSRRVFPEREEPWVLARVLCREGGEGGQFVEAGTILEPKGFAADERLSWAGEERSPTADLACRVEFRSESGRRRARSDTLTLGWEAVPAAPRGLTAVGGEGAVSLAWESPGGALAVLRYRVYRREPGAGGPEPLGPEAGSELSRSDSRVGPGREYCYSVRAVAAGRGCEVEGPASEERCARTEDATPPPAPSGLRVTALGEAFLLTWEPSAAPDLLGYHVYRAVGEGNAERVTPAPLEGAAYRDTMPEAEPGTPVRWSVTAVDRSPRRNESPLSAPVSAAVPPRAAP